MKCNNCGGQIIIGFRYVETEYKGLKFKYDEMLGVCKDCSQEIDIPMINDFNEVSKREIYNHLLDITIPNIKIPADYTDRLNALMEILKKEYEMPIL